VTSGAARRGEARREHERRRDAGRAHEVPRATAESV
jgi:hypothetical protein